MPSLITRHVGIGGIVVIVLAIILKVRWLKTGRRPWIFKGDKNPITTSFGGETKPSVASQKILRTLKNPKEYERDILSAMFTSISRQFSPDSLLVVFLSILITKELRG
jgi:hypothetical protein